MQYELKKCQDQTGMKNDKLDDKTRWELIHFLKNAEEDIRYERACSSSKRNTHGRKTGQDTTESTSDTTVSETDTTGHES